MARRIKPAAVTSVSDMAAPEPPAAGRPVDGYAEDELSKAFEVVRHQAMVLRARSRVAAAALGATPAELEPEPPLLRVVGGDARAQADLDAARDDAEATRRRYEQLYEELAPRERELAQLADRLAADAARLEHERQDLAARHGDLERDATKRLAAIEAQLASLERDRQALKDAERAAHGRSLAREKELATAEAAVVQREAALEREARQLDEMRKLLADDRAAVGALQERMNDALAAVAGREDRLRAVAGEYQTKAAQVERDAEMLEKARLELADERAALETREREHEDALEQMSAKEVAELEARLASLERDRLALKDAEHAAHGRSLAREKELATAEAAVVQREAALEREARQLDEMRKQLADDHAAVGALQERMNDALAAVAGREDQLRAVAGEYQTKAARIERDAEMLEQARLELADERTELAELRRDLDRRTTALETREREHEDVLEQMRTKEAEITERLSELNALEARQREALDHLRGEEESFAQRAKAAEAAERALEAGRAALDDELRVQAEAADDLKSREAEVERTRAELAAERRRLEDEKRLIAELRVSLDQDARASQTMKEELDQHAAELARQARALAERAASAAAGQPEQVQPQEAVSHEEGRPRSRFTVDELATLMERRADEYPDRIEEWQYYLVSLRNVATSDGRLPDSVEYLVEDVFAPLLETSFGRHA